MYSANINLKYLSGWWNRWNAKKHRHEKVFSAPGIKHARKVLKILNKTKHFRFTTNIKDKILHIKEKEK